MCIVSWYLYKLLLQAAKRGGGAVGRGRGRKKSGENASLLALKAGADLVLLKAPEDVCERTINHIMTAVKNKEITEGDFDEKVARILRAKFRLGLFEESIDEKCTTNDGGCKFNPEKAMEPIECSTIKATTREGFGENLFRDWKYDKQGQAVADFDRDGDLDMIVGHHRIRKKGEGAQEVQEIGQIRMYENLMGDSRNWY